MQKVSLRTVTMPIQSQQIITKDNVSIGVAAVAYYRRNDPVKTILEITDVERAVYEIAQTTVRNVVGRSLLDQVLSETETLNEATKLALDDRTSRWGVDVIFPAQFLDSARTLTRFLQAEYTDGAQLAGATAVGGSGRSRPPA